MSLDYFSKFNIIGAGAFGTALGRVVEDATGCQPLYLVRRVRGKGQTTRAIDIQEADALIYAARAPAFPDVLVRLLEADLQHKPLLVCAKGLLKGKQSILFRVASSMGWKGQVAVLSGPGFAEDIMQRRPFAVSIASKQLDTARAFCMGMSTPAFRPYASNDPVGISLAGALKNVIAIACGICMGLELGESARAALMTRGLAEISRLGKAMGAREKSFFGLAGVGDIALTCASSRSRNYRCGLALGQGKPLQEIKEIIGTIEGIETTAAAVDLALQHMLEMPITAQLYKILYEGQAAEKGMENLLSRSPGFE